jgi:hypothetical protein
VDGDEAFLQGAREGQSSPPSSGERHPAPPSVSSPPVPDTVPESALLIPDEAELYWSFERGVEPIADMNPLHARRAARAVREGRRVGGADVVRALDRQGRRDVHTTR